MYRIKSFLMGAIAVAALGAGSAALASPSWGAEPQVRACGLSAWEPDAGLRGRVGRGGCAGDDKVTYLWGRIYRDINNWPDAVHGEKYQTYVANGYFDVAGSCGKRAAYYTEASDSRGNASESGHPWRC
jgi:hypothetical protein